jgi:hypothetical protein
MTQGNDATLFGVSTSIGVHRVPSSTKGGWITRSAGVKEGGPAWVIAVMVVIQVPRPSKLVVPRKKCRGGEVEKRGDGVAESRTTILFKAEEVDRSTVVQILHGAHLYGDPICIRSSVVSLDGMNCWKATRY